MMTLLAQVKVAGFLALAVAAITFVVLVGSVLFAIARMFMTVARWLFGPPLRDSARPLPSSPEPCPHARCGHVNRAGARFCGRCGRALRRSFENRVA